MQNIIKKSQKKWFFMRFFAMFSASKINPLKKPEKINIKNRAGCDKVS